MMGEGMAPYADTEHRRGFFGFGEKPDAKTSKADETSTAPELSPATEVSPVAGDMGVEQTADTGIAEAAVTGASTSVESPDMASANVDSLTGSPDGSAKVDLGDAPAEPGVGATETPDASSDAPPSSENVVTPLTPTDTLLGDTAEGKADASLDAANDTATQPDATSEAVLDATPEAPTSDNATSTFEAMLAEDAGTTDGSTADADSKAKPVGPDKIMDPSEFIADTEQIDKAMEEQLNLKESAPDTSPATTDAAEAATEAPMITATTPEITAPTSEPAPAASEFPTLNADADADSDPATETLETAPTPPADTPAPAMPESPLTSVDEASSTDSASEVSTTDASEETPGANEAVAEELASPAAESDTEVTPAAPEATLASVADIAHKLSAADKARLIAELAGDMEKAA